jgi:putative transcriptional regulator
MGNSHPEHREEVYATAVKPLTGHMLIAGAGIAAGIFRQTVVLVAEHDDGGAVGFVVNRPTDALVSNVAPALAALPLSDQRLYVGGPVQRDAVAVLAEFAEPALASRLVLGSVGFVPPDALPGIAEATTRAKVFVGYAGWGPGQLDSEVENDGWIVEPAVPDDVFAGEPERLWRDVLRRKGPAFRLLSTMPFDPSVN